MTVKKLIGQAPSQAPRNRDLGSMAYQDVSLVKGPAFGATMSANQYVTSGTYTKVQFNSEQFDTNNNYDPVTNYRFTPTVAGYYQVNVTMDVGGASAVQAFGHIRKNGSTAATASGVYGGNAGNEQYISGSAILYMNGSTDYIEIYVLLVSTSPLVYTASYFSASMVRAA